MNTLKYRPDIDGLRAIAVLSVILFHAGMPFMTGGFVGVDVFFVISGYLITSLILNDLGQGTFSLSGFWERRARRILPAFFTVTLATLAAGWFLLLPDDYAALGKQVAAQSVFASNILFYKQAGYFDASAFLKPMLHTWSLAVEEQFYLLFPLAMLLLWKKAKGHMAFLLTLAALLSFILCLIVMGHNKSLAFYMLPFRAWELLLGALLTQTRKTAAPRMHEMAGLLGLAAILLSAVFYTDKTPFPGWAAVPPCLGTALIIWSGTFAPTYLTRCLSWRPVVFVGLVSYSWYLWHWPVIVFVKYISFIAFTPAMATACVSGSFILAVLSWKFIEKPFRQKTCLADRRHLSAAALGVLLVFALSGLILINGLPERLDPLVVSLASGVSDMNTHRKQCDKTHIDKINADEVCQTLENSGLTPSYMLWGDSHADAIAPAFYDLSKEFSVNGYVATHHGCPPILDYHKKSWSPDFDCTDYNRAVLDFIARHKIKKIFMVASWSTWMNYERDNPADLSWPEKYETTPKALQKTLDILKRNGARIYIMGDVPSAEFDPPRTLAMEKLYHRTWHAPLVNRDIYLKKRADNIDNFMKKTNGVGFIDPAMKICQTGTCIVEHNGHSLYYNQEHLSAYGARYLVDIFRPYFKE